MNGRIGIGLLLFAALACVSRRAEAFAAPNISIPARMAPAATTIPHNFPGFGYDAPNAQSSNVHLVDTTKGAAELPLTFGPVTGPWNKVVPQAGFTVGDSYTLSFDSLCYGMALPEQKPLTFTIVADAPLPTMLGDVMGTPTVVVKNHGTSEVTFDATYTLAAEMKPWAAVYELVLTLNGRPLETHPTVSAGGDTVHIASRGWCDDAGAKNTKNVVSLRATMPFATTLETPPTELAFTCPAAHIVTPTPATLTPPTDTGSSAPTTGSSRGGCSVRPGSESGGALGAIGVALGLAIVLRKRTKKGAR
jgi:MYXO-CTERM domain-containing protein